MRWARARELRAGFSVVGSPHASVEEVGAALALRERVAALAAQTHGPRRRGAAGRLEGLVIDVADLQGGIVRGYGQRFGFARHLFARVREPRAARAFLAALADPVTTEQEWAGHPDTTLNVALSYRALAALELPAWILDGFPAELRDGMAARAERLGDDPARGTTSCATSRSCSSCTPRAPRRSRPRPGAGSARCVAQDSGLELAHVQPAGLLGQQREHFGFTDGFSQPAIEGVAREDVRGQGIPYKRVPWWPLSRTRWRAIKPGEFVLGYEDEDRGPAPAPPAPFDRNASFMVWRKLHQDVARLPRPARRAGPAAGARRGARRGQARRALARRQPAGAAPGRPRPRRSATTSSAPTTSATATTSSGCAARAAPTCGARTRATRSAGRAG